jgi:hypothetical protein
VKEDIDYLKKAEFFSKSFKRPLLEQQPFPKSLKKKNKDTMRRNNFLMNGS